MLKIKDSISLSELEKFGFVDKKRDFINNDFGGEFIAVDKFNRNIYIQVENMYAIAEDSFGLIYDLIKADLVEKIENEM